MSSGLDSNLSRVLRTAVRASCRGLHDVMPRGRGGVPEGAGPLVEILAEVLIDGVLTVARTAMRKGIFELGEHLKVYYGGYSHHGIYTGNDFVVHLSKATKFIQQDALEDFRNGRCQIWVVPSPKKYAGAEIVERAESRLGESGYNVFTNNCEHFCHWCRSGQMLSPQVERWQSEST